MEIFGGFAVMMSILGSFLVVVWLIMPFVVLTIKGKLDKALETLEDVEKRLSAMEALLTEARHEERRHGVSHPAISPGNGNGAPSA